MVPKPENSVDMIFKLTTASCWVDDVGTTASVPKVTLDPDRTGVQGAHRQAAADV